ncbi:hypothetical protein NECAME_07994, partial [Necator americanus]
KKRKKGGDGPIPKKKSATGGKKGKNYAKEKEKQKLTKKMKRQLAAVQQRKANKLTQEELFASLAEYQLDAKKINQLSSSSQMQNKLKGFVLVLFIIPLFFIVFLTTMVLFSSIDEDADFPTKIKSISSKIKLPATIHQKERVQENYYPTDDESSDEDEEFDHTEDCEASTSTPQKEQNPVEVEVKVEENDICRESEQHVPEPDASSSSGVQIETSKNALLPQGTSTLPPQKVKTEDGQDVQSKSVVPVIQRKRVLVARDPNIEAKRAHLPIYSEEVPIMETINENIKAINL